MSEPRLSTDATASLMNMSFRRANSLNMLGVNLLQLVLVSRVDVLLEWVDNVVWCFLQLAP